MNVPLKVILVVLGLCYSVEHQLVQAFSQTKAFDQNIIYNRGFNSQTNSAFFANKRYRAVANDAGCRWLAQRINQLQKSQKKKYQSDELISLKSEWRCLRCAHRNGGKRPSVDCRTFR